MFSLLFSMSATVLYIKTPPQVIINPKFPGLCFRGCVIVIPGNTGFYQSYIPYRVYVLIHLVIVSLTHVGPWLVWCPCAVKQLLVTHNNIQCSRQLESQGLNYRICTRLQWGYSLSDLKKYMHKKYIKIPWDPLLSLNCLKHGVVF